ncbi:MAG: hypothetical protein VX619_07285 [bacterium]|nr:hypothetical protein [bacterium]
MLKNRLVLVPSAAEAEVVLDVLNPFLTINKTPYTVHKATGNGEDLLVVECGVGPNLAAAAVAWSVAGFSLSEVILIGLAGLSPDSHLALGDLVSVSEVLSCRLGGMRNGSFEGIDNVLPLTSFNPQVKTKIQSSESRLKLNEVICVSSEFVSREPSDLDYLKQFEGAQIEAMETAGFAQAASLMDVPWFELRALSNHWGVSDHRNWKWDLCKNQLAQAAKLIAEGPLRKDA